MSTQQENAAHMGEALGSFGIVPDANGEYSPDAHERFERALFAQFATHAAHSLALEASDPFAGHHEIFQDLADRRQEYQERIHETSSAPFDLQNARDTALQYFSPEEPEYDDIYIPDEYIAIASAIQQRFGKVEEKTHNYPITPEEYDQAFAQFDIPGNSRPETISYARKAALVWAILNEADQVLNLNKENPEGKALGQEQRGILQVAIYQFGEALKKKGLLSFRHPDIHTIITAAKKRVEVKKETLEAYNQRLLKGLPEKGEPENQEVEQIRQHVISLAEHNHWDAAYVLVQHPTYNLTPEQRDSLLKEIGPATERYMLGSLMVDAWRGAYDMLKNQIRYLSPRQVWRNKRVAFAQEPIIANTLFLGTAARFTLLGQEFTDLGRDFGYYVHTPEGRPIHITHPEQLATILRPYDTETQELIFARTIAMLQEMHCIGRSELKVPEQVLSQAKVLFGWDTDHPLSFVLPDGSEETYLFIKSDSGQVTGIHKQSAQQ